MRYHFLSDLGVIQITGKDANSFLQGQLTCDVREVHAQQTRIGALCNNKGRALATFRLWHWQNGYLMQLPQEMIALTLQTLNKYAQFSSVELQDVSADWLSIGCSAGPSPDMTIVNHLMTPVAKDLSRQIILAPGSSSKSALIESLAKQGEPADVISWQLADIQNGLAIVTLSTSGLFTPHDLNYPNLGGVSFNKGCYTGQEIVTRMQFRGKLKQHLYAVRIPSVQPLMPGNTMLLSDSASVVIVNAIRNNAEQAGDLQAPLQYDALIIAHDQTITDNKDRGLFTLLDIPENYYA